MASPHPLKPGLRFASDHSLLVTFAGEMDEATRLDVLRVTRLLLQESRKEILNIHPGYSSVLITFDPRIAAPSRLESQVRQLLEGRGSMEIPRSRTVDIPVCYDNGFAPDLEHVAQYHGLTQADVIRLHSSALYVVHFLGFTPGFPYLGCVPGEIATPRRTTPRVQVAAGSVAIGGRQTGVYTVSSPGGWQIIGKTPLRLFDAGREPPVLLQMGDHVRFVPIKRLEFDAFSPDPVGVS